MIDPKLIEA
jgi:Zn finger protein HypA/HybF involved in hydrogenase expression